MRILTLALIALVAAGCSSSEGSGLSADQEKMSQNVSDWAKSSNGDWNKLTPEQQQTLTKGVGTEEGAKKLLEMKAHGPAPVAPGRPSNPGGPPPGAGQ